MMNNEILESIFCNTRDDFFATKALERVITNEIDELIEPFKELSPVQYEELKDLLFSSALSGEKQGFILGFKYAVHLLVNNGAVEI